MTEDKNWDKLHDYYANTDWINQTAEFAQWVMDYFPKAGSLLDLGGGQGQDTRYFAAKGYQVTLVDISTRGLELAREKTPTELRDRITFVQHDISQPLPFPDESFDIVYSHLVIHYFDEATTQQIFDEIYRVLKPDGIMALFTNSVNDPEYKTGHKLDTDFYEVEGVQKRFFSQESIQEFAKKFKILEVDEHGSTPKERAISTSNLVRYVGKKYV